MHGKWLLTFQSIELIITFWQFRNSVGRWKSWNIDIKMPDFGFINLCAESKGVFFLAKITWWLAVSVGECTFILTKVTSGLCFFVYLMVLAEVDCSFCLVCVTGLLWFGLVHRISLGCSVFVIFSLSTPLFYHRCVCVYMRYFTVN